MTQVNEKTRESHYRQTRIDQLTHKLSVINIAAAPFKIAPEIAAELKNDRMLADLCLMISADPSLLRSG